MRTQVAYIPGGFLNKAASTGQTGSTEPVTGLAIGTGVTLGDFYELTDAQADRFSSKQVNSVTILTAGSGQTNGIYSTTASAGGATISYTVAGGAVTAVTITNGGTYASGAAAPTFTLAANGGTAGTVQAIIGQLYTGIFQWVKLDPAVTGTVALGVPLYWLQTDTGYVATTVATANTNNPDFCGVSIDTGWGAALPYAWIQVNGKVNVQYVGGGTAPTYGAVVNTSAATSNFAALTSGTLTVTQATVGIALAAGAAGTIQLARITRAQSRY